MDYRSLQILMLLIIHSCFTLLGQVPKTPRFERIGIQQGLPGRYVYAMTQDSKGFIWIGTSFGLSRYDGYQIENYLYDPIDSSGINDIVSLLEDDKGRLWMGTQSEGLKYLDLKTGFYTHFRHDDRDTNSISSDNLAGIYQDSDKTMWIATYGGGLNRWDEANQGFVHYRHQPGNSTTLSNDLVNAIYEDSHNHIWVGTDFGLNLYHRESDSFSQFYLNPKETFSEVGFLENSVANLHEDELGRLWIASYGGGLYSFNGTHFYPTTRFLNDPTNPKSIGANSINSINHDRSNGLWVGWYGGLSFLNLQDQSFQQFKHNPLIPSSLSNNSVNLTFVDSEKNLWIGTRNGVNLLQRTNNGFVTLTYQQNGKEGLSSNMVNSAVVDSEGVLWIGTIGGGLDRVEQATGEVIHYRHDANNPYSISGNYIGYVYEDSKENLWIGTIEEGLNLYDRLTGQFIRFQHDPKDSTSILEGAAISKIFEDKKGRIWLGTSRGLLQFILEEKRFIHFPFGVEEDPDFKQKNIILDDLVEDKNGDFWIPYWKEGLVRFNPETGVFTQFLHESGNSNTLSSNYNGQLLIDRRGNLLVPTAVGLDRLIFEPEDPLEFKVQQKILKGSVTSLLEDHYGMLWVGCLHGLYRYDPETGSFRKYNTADGLQSTAFRGRTYKDPKTNVLYFPTNDGLLTFHPDSLRDNLLEPNIVISTLYYYDSEEDSGVPVEVPNISYQDEVTLPYHQNSIVIEVAALSYQKTAKNQYAYRFEGREETWNQLGTERRLQFPDLSPGRYDLRVKGSNGDGVWNKGGTRLMIVIFPPWWWSVWAKIVYVLLILSLLYGVYRFQLNRQLARTENLRLRELDEVKTRLYTNITHEFRTPLTIILGMADQVVKNPKEWVLEGTRMIKRNGQRLLYLVNQMLDLSKLESGTLPVKMINADIIAYLRYINESFHSFTEIRGISLHFLCFEESYPMDYDPDKVLDIVTNLLSNAIKYSPEGGNIYMQVQGIPEKQRPLFEIKVIDQGMGMDPADLKHIFDRFYQLDDQHTSQSEGTGIGLALTKELVKLLGGTITADSQKGKGSTFTVQLPVSQEAEKESMQGALLPHDQLQLLVDGVTFSTSEDISLERTNQSLLLIVEDNPDIVQYIISCLDGKYRLATAPDGQAGIEKAIELVPDIIISDVMMPQKDGFELCYTLKKDPRTSHIPIILLSAKADQNSKLEGLRKGADAYLTKPFDQNELQVRLAQLVELRREMQGRFGHFAQQMPMTIAETHSIEDEFLRKIRQLVEANISDVDYGILQLCSSLHLSRSQLFRKVKALTGQSTSLFIRSIRLQKAKELLQSTNLSISEIAYDVGFTSPAYFTRAFSEVFGGPPSKIRE